MGKKNNFLTGALIGGVAAAATALLYAPKAGKEVRKDIADQLDGFVGKGADVSGNLKKVAAKAIMQSVGIAEVVLAKTDETLHIFKKPAHPSPDYKETGGEMDQMAETDWSLADQYFAGDQVNQTEDIYVEVAGVSSTPEKTDSSVEKE